MCVFIEVKRKEANQPPLSRFSRAVSVSNYIFGRLLWYIYTIGTYVKGSESHEEVAVESRLRLPLLSYQSVVELYFVINSTSYSTLLYSRNVNLYSF